MEVKLDLHRSEGRLLVPSDRHFLAAACRCSWVNWVEGTGRRWVSRAACFGGAHRPTHIDSARGGIHAGGCGKVQCHAPPDQAVLVRSQRELSATGRRVPSHFHPCGRGRHHATACRPRHQRQQLEVDRPGQRSD